MKRVSNSVMGAVLLVGCHKTGLELPLDRSGYVNAQAALDAKLTPVQEQAVSLHDEAVFYHDCGDGSIGASESGRALAGVPGDWVGDKFVWSVKPNDEINAFTYRSLGYVSRCMTSLKPLIAKALEDGKITWVEHTKIEEAHREAWDAEHAVWYTVEQGLREGAKRRLKPPVPPKVYTIPPHSSVVIPIGEVRLK